MGCSARRGPVVAGMPDYDAIVCGGSFAGLAAASQIGGRVLVIDSQDIGEGETSASAVPLECLERLDLLDCVEQVHQDVVLHTRRRSVRMHFFPFATFSYSRFCTDLAARTGADILRARIRSAGAGVVDTSEGRLTAPIIIEAAGWRTSGVSGGDRDDVRPRRKSFGIEARQPFRGGDGLHFYVGPSLGRRRFYWAFPAGDHIRAGLAAYDGHSALGRELQPFLDRVGLGEAGAQHGGFFTSRLSTPVRDGMFVVGDAAGHCLPVSGEGIRPALVFGQVAGRLAERVRLGEMTLHEALRRHSAFLDARRRAYTALDRLQTLLNRTPDPLFSAFARLVAQPQVLGWGTAHYRRVADPALLTATRSRDPLP